uniref:BZIP domain-containing protein n=1 Tax=Strongyloides venezuelensis TaxID=75913 RepID=A0A0K0FGU0_STRVS
MDNYYNPPEIPFGQFKEEYQNEDYSNNIESNKLMSCESAINIDSCMMGDENFGDIIRYFEGDDNVNSDFDEILKKDIKKGSPVQSNDLTVPGFEDGLDNMNNICNNFTFNENSYDTNLNQFSDYPDFNYSSRASSAVSSMEKVLDINDNCDTPKPGPMRPRRNTTKRKNQYPDYIYDDSETSSSKSHGHAKRTRVAVLNTPYTRPYNAVPQEERDEIWLEKRKRNNEAVVKSRNKKKEKLEAEHRELEELRVKSKEDAATIKSLQDEIFQRDVEINDMKKKIIQLNAENNSLKVQIQQNQSSYKVHNPRIVVSQRPSVTNSMTRGRMELYPPHHDSSFRRG